MDLVGFKAQNEKQGSEIWDELNCPVSQKNKKEIWDLKWKKKERADNST